MIDFTCQQICSPTNRLKTTLSILLIICCICCVYTTSTFSADDQSDKPSSSGHSSGRQVRFADSDSAALPGSSSQNMSLDASQPPPARKSSKKRFFKFLFSTKKDSQASSHSSLNSKNDSDITGGTSTHSLHSYPDNIPALSTRNETGKNNSHSAEQKTKITGEQKLWRSQSMRERKKHPAIGAPDSKSDHKQQTHTPKPDLAYRIDPIHSHAFHYDNQLSPTTVRSGKQEEPICQYRVPPTKAPPKNEPSASARPSAHYLRLSTFQNHPDMVNHRLIQRARSLPSHYKKPNINPLSQTHIPNLTFKKKNKTPLSFSHFETNPEAPENSNSLTENYQYHYWPSVIEGDSETSFSKIKKVMNHHINQYFFPIGSQRIENKYHLELITQRLRKNKKNSVFKNKYLKNLSMEPNELFNSAVVQHLFSKFHTYFFDISFDDYIKSDFSPPPTTSVSSQAANTPNTDSHEKKVKRLPPKVMLLKQCIQEMTGILSNESNNYIWLKYKERNGEMYCKISRMLLNQFIGWTFHNCPTSEEIEDESEKTDFEGCLLLILTSCIAVEHYPEK